MFSTNTVDNFVNLDFKKAFNLETSDIYARTFIGDSLPHAHDFFELTYVTHGTVAHSLNFAKPEIIKKGDFILVDIGSVHEFAGIDKNSVCETITLSFTDSFIHDKTDSFSRLTDVFHCKRLNLPSNFAVTPSEIMLHDKNSLVYDYLMLILKHINMRKKQSGSALENLLSSLLITIAELSQNNIEHELSYTTAMLVNYIENHYNEQALLTTLSARMQYSVSYLSNKFHDEMGVSFNDYLKNQRIDVAKRLINTTSMKMPEISSLVGYTDHKYFSRVFKTMTNMTPQQYKRTIAKHLVK